MAPNAMLAVLAGSVLVSSLIQAVTMPFDSAVVALIYTDLRMRSEGLDVELRRAAGV
jgi:putative membrane protein